MSQVGEMLVINGSIRARASAEVVVDAAGRLTDRPALMRYIEEAARSGRIANTEGCGIAVAYGAQQEGATPKYLRLNEFVDRAGATRHADELLSSIVSASACVFLTPVYFGDRSSLVHDLMLLMRREGVDFTGKVAAVASVGAKRNGGQETTNIFTLYNLLQMNGLVVGNGPPTAQYGGTAVGGSLGAIGADHFGLETAIGVGSRLARALTLLRVAPRTRPRIALCVLEDTANRRLFDYLGERSRSFPSTARWEIHDLASRSIRHCLACAPCPAQPQQASYKCQIRNDDMRCIQQHLVGADGIVLCGLNTGSESQKISCYQRFIERTRYLRRDDFRLSDRLFMPLSINTLFADNAFDIRVLTSFVRHNAIGHRGVSAYELAGKTVESRLAEVLQSFQLYSAKSAQYRLQEANRPNRYESIGY